MRICVTDEDGSPFVYKTQTGGSNNIAELSAIKEALLWAIAHDEREIEIRTDSKNNFAWVYGHTVGQQINDRNAVLILKTEIDAARSMLSRFTMKLVYRDQNQAGLYLEGKVPLRDTSAMRGALEKAGLL
jgi:ribonuclease HI